MKKYLLILIMAGCASKMKVVNTTCFYTILSKDTTDYHKRGYYIYKSVTQHGDTGFLMCNIDTCVGAVLKVNYTEKRK